MRPCLDCPELVPLPRSRCSIHERANRQRRKEEGRTGARGSTRAWRRLREFILSRDGRRCVRCGSLRYLTVHHIDLNPRNDNEENLVTLCEDCHKLKHKEAEGVA